MADQKKESGGSADDDTYVIEDTGDTIEDIEHEMEVTAEEAEDTITRHSRETVRPESPSPPSDQSEEVRKLSDRLMRTVADFENFRKRAEREKVDFQRYAIANLMKNILPVLDNFDRGLDHAEEGDEFHKGVLLIYKQLYDILRKNGLKPVEESGVRFDPNLHEAVIREEDSSVPNHTVVAILQKGYFLHDRLLRPAMVRVAVGGPDEPDGVN